VKRPLLNWNGLFSLIGIYLEAFAAFFLRSAQRALRASESFLRPSGVSLRLLLRFFGAAAAAAAGFLPRVLAAPLLSPANSLRASCKRAISLSISDSISETCIDPPDDFLYLRLVPVRVAMVDANTRQLVTHL